MLLRGRRGRPRPGLIEGLRAVAAVAMATQHAVRLTTELTLTLAGGDDATSAWLAFPGYIPPRVWTGEGPAAAGWGMALIVALDVPGLEAGGLGRPRPAALRGEKRVRHNQFYAAFRGNRTPRRCTPARP